MTATIMMPQQIDSAIRDMCADAMSQAVVALADKYGFDVEEANRFLAADTLKIVRKRGPPASPKAAPKPKTASKTKSAADSDKPKRAKTGYLLYADEVRAEVKSSLTAELEEGAKLKPQDVVRAIATQWNAEDQEVRDEWNIKAKTPATSDDEAMPDSAQKPETPPESAAEAEAEAEAEDAAAADAGVVPDKPKKEKKEKKKEKKKE